MLIDPIAMDDMGTSDAGGEERRGGRIVLPLYAPYYGLSEAPFDLTPNPRFVFLAGRHREVLSNLRYALATSKGFTLVLGEAGTGKTTLVRTAMAGIEGTAHRYVVVNNPTLGRQEFYEFLAAEFGLSAEAAQSKARFLAELQRDVDARFAAGGLTGLIVDEAQSMPHELLEEIRLLGNIETTTTKLLNIVLCGQPELAGRLNESSLRQLKQRVALRCELRPFSLADTASYISGRLRIAGGAPHEIFTRDAVIGIFEGSGGIPRTINVIADNALIGGFAAQAKPVPANVVEEVCRDFDLGAKHRAAAPQNEGAGDAAAAAPAGVPATAVPPRALPAGDDEPAASREMFGMISTGAKRRFFFFP